MDKFKLKNNDILSDKNLRTSLRLSDKTRLYYQEPISYPTTMAGVHILLNTIYLT